MKGTSMFSDVEILNPFMSFMRSFDDFGPVSWKQVVGQYIIAFLNLILITIQVITSSFVVVILKGQVISNSSLLTIREIFGYQTAHEINSVFSLYSFYAVVLVLIFSIVSLGIHIYHLNSKTLSSFILSKFSSIYDICSPCILTLVIIIFFTSLLNLIQDLNSTWATQLILCLCCFPACIFGTFKLLSDTRMDKLPFVSPNIANTTNFFIYYLSSIVASIYNEYTSGDRNSSLFISICLTLYGIWSSYKLFAMPCFHNIVHCVLAMLITYLITITNFVVFLSLFLSFSRKTYFLTIYGSGSIYLTLVVMHSVVAHVNVRKLLNSLDTIDPKNYSANRLCRILCVADVRKDQNRFPPNFPEKVLQAFPKNHSIVLFALLYKLYDVNCHKEILKFTQQLSIFDSTNMYIIPMLRSVNFVASCHQPDSKFTSTLLKYNYNLYYAYWYYIIQNNRIMSKLCLNDISSFVEKVSTFFNQHKSVAFDYKRFVKNIVFKADVEIYGDELDSLSQDSEHMSTAEKLNFEDEDFVLEEQDGFIERLAVISQVKPPGYRQFVWLLVAVNTILILVIIFPYIGISRIIIMSLITRSATRDFYDFYCSFILVWSIPVHTQIYPINSTMYDSYITSLKNTGKILLKYSFIAENSTRKALMEEGLDAILNTAQNGNFTQCLDVTQNIIEMLYDYGYDIHTLYNTRRALVNLALYICIALIVIGLFHWLFLCIWIYRLGDRIMANLSYQPMQLSKLFSTMVLHKYQYLAGSENKEAVTKNRLNHSFLLLFTTLFLPLVVIFAYTMDMHRIHNKYLSFTSTTLFFSQIAGTIGLNSIFLPAIYNSSVVNDSFINDTFETFAAEYGYLDSLITTFMDSSTTGVYDFNSSDDNVIIHASDLTQDDIDATIMQANQSIFVDFYNSSSILLRDMYILLRSMEIDQNVKEAAYMALPASIYSGGPVINLFHDFLTVEQIINDSLIFSIAITPFVLIVLVILMLMFSVSTVSKFNIAIDLIYRILSLADTENPFFDDDGTFTGFKDPPYPLIGEIYDALPIPTFQLDQKKNIIEVNDYGQEIFSDVIGMKAQNLPNEVVDTDGRKHYYSYNIICHSSLPKNSDIHGDAVAVSTDLTGIYTKREMLKALNKDIKLTFSIPTILQREKPSHIQEIAVVNFCFSETVQNNAFLMYSMKIEDMFSQFVSFFMFEKQRFSFYVLFHDNSGSRQPSRDAVSFAQIARETAKLHKIDVKIAVSLESEIITRAEQRDMIWSVTFLNSILWRTDQMFKYIDYGKVGCVAKMMPGMHYTKSIHIGRFNEQIEVIML